MVYLPLKTTAQKSINTSIYNVITEWYNLHHKWHWTVSKRLFGQLIYSSLVLGHLDNWLPHWFGESSNESGWYRRKCWTSLICLPVIAGAPSAQMGTIFFRFNHLSLSKSLIATHMFSPLSGDQPAGSLKKEQKLFTQPCHLRHNKFSMKLQVYS